MPWDVDESNQGGVEVGRGARGARRGVVFRAALQFTVIRILPGARAGGQLGCRPPRGRGRAGGETGSAAVGAGAGGRTTVDFRGAAVGARRRAWNAGTRVPAGAG